MQVVYLDELGKVEHLPLWIALMVLTIVSDDEAPKDARTLIRRAIQEKSAEENRVIIETVAAIISYKFDQLSQREIHKMLDISPKETRLYREVTQEARQAGRTEGQAELLLRQLLKLFRELPEDVLLDVRNLPASELEALGEAIFDFGKLSDLRAWLEARP